MLVKDFNLRIKSMSLNASEPEDSRLLPENGSEDDLIHSDVEQCTTPDAVA